MTRLSAPIFSFGDSPTLSADDSYTRPFTLEGMLAMTGPSVTADPGCLPVRGDLAHIKLAGRYFVPHYAVPMPHKVSGATALRAVGRIDADAICDVPAGTTFNVLDIAGDWAWGQCGEDGHVGYLPMNKLEAI
jgi:hypothetical protein